MAWKFRRLDHLERECRRRGRTSRAAGAMRSGGRAVRCRELAARLYASATRAVRASQATASRWYRRHPPGAEGAGARHGVTAAGVGGALRRPGALAQAARVGAEGPALY